MNICVIGTGYVGLVAGACLAEFGNNVICVDKDVNKITNLNSGIIPIYEPNLEEIVKSNILHKRLKFSIDLDMAVKQSDACFIAVGTPSGEDGSCDLQHVLNVVEQIAKSMNGYKIIVNKSTVPVGTAKKVVNIIKKYTNYSFDVVSNPEFLKQGSAVEDFMSPERIIIGVNSNNAIKIMQEIYSCLKDKIIVMDIESAEVTKFAANSFLATKISFMNEIANLCEKVGANVEKVRQGIASDSRIGSKHLYPGLGYGGSCFPKDVKALLNTAKENKCEMKIIKATDEINNKQRIIFTEKILDYYNNDVMGKTFAIWGLAFKPETDDMREAPAVTIINNLLEKGARIKAYDPKAMQTANVIFEDKIDYAKSAYDALESVDALLLLTEWEEFRKPDFEKIKLLLKTPVIFDGRNQYNSDELQEKGFQYFCIGKK